MKSDLETDLFFKILEELPKKYHCEKHKISTIMFNNKYLCAVSLHDGHLHVFRGGLFKQFELSDPNCFEKFKKYLKELEIVAPGASLC